MAISSSVPRVLQGAPEVAAPAELISSTRSSSSPSPSPSKAVRVDLEPELRVVASSDGIRNWPTVDLVVAVNAVKLHLYDGAAATEANVKDHGIARFILNSTTLRFKQLSDGAAEAQLVLKSITMTNTRPAASKIFREIIPAADHDRNQFMLLFTMSGGQNGLSVAILTVDTPQIILAIDPVISLLVFFTSAPPVEEADNDEVEGLTVRDSSPKGDSGSSLDFRVDLHGVAVTILENDTDANSQAIKLSINEILLSQQVCRTVYFRTHSLTICPRGSWP
jgi:vacuolar protein sorting-associated protein 13A/C